MSTQQCKRNEMVLSLPKCVVRKTYSWELRFRYSFYAVVKYFFCKLAQSYRTQKWYFHQLSWCYLLDSLAMWNVTLHLWNKILSRWKNFISYNSSNNNNNNYYYLLLLLLLLLLRNDLFCVEWDVKPQLNQSIDVVTCIHTFISNIRTTQPLTMCIKYIQWYKQE